MKKRACVCRPDSVCVCGGEGPVCVCVCGGASVGGEGGASVCVCEGGEGGASVCVCGGEGPVCVCVCVLCARLQQLTLSLASRLATDCWGRGVPCVESGLAASHSEPIRHNK